MIQQIRKFTGSVYLSWRFFLALGVIALISVLGFFWIELVRVSMVLLVALGAVVFFELIGLYTGRGMTGSRLLPEKLSMGDENLIGILLQSKYTLPVTLRIYDELPLPWQVRDFYHKINLKPAQEELIHYTYRPTRRGRYLFGKLNVLVSIGPGFLQRRFRLEEDQETAVYPSFLSVRKYEYLAISNRLHESGIKKIRRIGHNYEFEKIKEYVAGDDFRTINWRATARKAKLMVNQYQDERSQQIWSILDKGRVMNQPFEEMTLLDHSINASLVLANIALRKYDKAGLITFGDRQAQVLPADRKGGHMLKFQEMLYAQETDFLESDYERLFLQVQKNIRQRSLLVLYTNFDTVASMERRLPYLRAIARKHLLLVVFFENTETGRLISGRANNLHDIYRKTIAEKFNYEKEQIVMELKKYGIMALLTPPAELTVNTINRYLELKARGLI